MKQGVMMLNGLDRIRSVTGSCEQSVNNKPFGSLTNQAIF